MPITVYATEGVLSEPKQKELFAALTDTFLKLHNLNGNKFLTPNVIGEVNIIPKGKSFSGGKPADIVIVEVKVPGFALESTEQKQAWIAQATDLVLAAAGGKVTREHVFANMVYAIDGLWGIGGKAYTNKDLTDAVARAAVVQ
jgi:phenylpyruvate tautomerase PptA (4-oxalocrotonate tautomerase family)